MLYVGLDVHSRQSSLCILNANGGLVNRCEVKGPRSAVVDRLRQLKEPFSVCYEVSCGYGHLYEQLRPLARHVAVAYPARLRLIFGSKRKNNRFDGRLVEAAAVYRRILAGGGGQPPSLPRPVAPPPFHTLS